MAAVAPLIGVLAVFLASFCAFVVLFSGSPKVRRSRPRGSAYRTVHAALVPPTGV
jgi:hypothetical protein